MTTNENPDIFREDWLACLGAHYLHTLRTGDLNNAQGLRTVLIEAGLAEPDIDALAISAGFTPDSQVDTEISAKPEIVGPVSSLEVTPDSPADTAEPAIEAPMVNPEFVSDSRAETWVRPNPTTVTDDPPVVPDSSPAPDLFSLLPAEDVAPAPSTPPNDPTSPAQPAVLPLPLDDASDDPLSNPPKKVRPKPRKPNAPQQQSLF